MGVRGLLLLCLMLAAVSAVAETDSLSTTQMGEAVVFGERVNRHNLTPASVSVVSARDLTNHSVTAVSHLTAIMPNLFIPEYGSRQTRPVSIRGIMSRIKGSAVGFYVDGMPRFETSSFDTDMLDVKSIEVYRGPQSTLYGRNTLGGVINVHMLSPLEYQGTRVRLGYGNYNDINAQASHYSRIGEKWAVNAGAYYRHSDGFYRNVYLDRDADSHNASGGRMGLYFKPSAAWTLRLTQSVDWLSQGGYPYAPYDAATGELQAVSYNRECGYDRLLTNTGFMAHYATADYSVTSQTVFEHIDDRQRLDQDFTKADLYMSSSAIDNNVLSQELTVKSENDSPLQWLAGAYGSWQWYGMNQGTDYLMQQSRTVADYSVPSQNAALYGQVSWRVWRGLSLTGGLRMDYEHSSQSLRRLRQSQGQQPVITESDASMSWLEFLPKFSLQYSFSRVGSVFASAARGYKAGGFNAVFETEDEKTFEPEYNWNYELGFKFHNRSNTFGGDVTFFYIDWRNQHVYRTAPQLGNVITNAGHSDSKGVELSLTARPVKGLLLQGSYGYTYARFLEYRKTVTADYSGRMLPLVPSNTMMAMASYSIEPRGWLDLITLSANVTGVGRLYWQEDNAVSQPFYALLGARVSARKGPVTLDVWGRNLTGTEYLSYCFVSSSRFAQAGAPRTCGVTVTVEM